MEKKFYSIYVKPVYAANIGDNYNWDLEDGEGDEILHMEPDLEKAREVFRKATTAWAGYNIVPVEGRLDSVEYEICELWEFELDEETDEYNWVATLDAVRSLPANVEEAMRKAEKNWHAFLDYEDGGSWKIADNI